MPAPALPCSHLSLEAGESPHATAPTAVAWLAIEQDGPWGRDAVTESGLDPQLGRELARRAGEHGVRLALVRAGSGLSEGGGRRVLAAHTRPGQEWTSRWRLHDPRELLELDLAALAAGVEPLGREVSTEPTILVCTNARRDPCCARNGLPLARALAARHPGQVWQSSHLGGHRFAPTAVVLPSGYLYGRLTITQAEEVLAAAVAQRLAHLDNLRGRSTWAAAGQLAEIAVRRHIGELDTRALTVSTVELDGAVTVSHVDGRRWAVLVREVTGEQRTRPESCGKADAPIRTLHAAQPRQV